MRLQSQLARVLSSALLVSCMLCWLPSTVAASGTLGLRADGELRNGPVGGSGGVSLAIGRAFYLSGAAENAGSVAPGETVLIVVEMQVRSTSGEFVPKEKLSVRLENGPQTIPGWEMDWRSAEGLLGDTLDSWDRTLSPGGTASLHAVFSVPHNTKDMWLHLSSKVGASPDKGVSGGMRFRLGDLPGDEDIGERPGQYVVVIGSFWNRSYALRWAADARDKGIAARVLHAGKPEGMYIVVVWQSSEAYSSQHFVSVVREQGYLDAYMLPPWKPAQ